MFAAERVSSVLGEQLALWGRPVFPSPSCQTCRSYIPLFCVDWRPCWDN